MKSFCLVAELGLIMGAVLLVRDITMGSGEDLNPLRCV